MENPSDILKDYLDDGVVLDYSASLKDLGIDSLDLMDAMISVCDEYGIPLDSVKEEAHKVKTPKDIDSFVKGFYDKRSESLRSF